MYCDEGGDLFFSAVLPVASAARSNTAAWMAAVCTWYSVIIEWVYEHMMREIAGYVGMLFSVLVHTRSNNCRGNAVSSSSSSSSSSSAC